MNIFDVMNGGGEGEVKSERTQAWHVYAKPKRTSSEFMFAMALTDVVWGEKISEPRKGFEGDLPKNILCAVFVDVGGDASAVAKKMEGRELEDEISVACFSLLAKLYGTIPYNGFFETGPKVLVKALAESEVVIIPCLPNMTPEESQRFIITGIMVSGQQFEDMALHPKDDACVIISGNTKDGMTISVYTDEADALHGPASPYEGGQVPTAYPVVPNVPSPSRN